MIRHELDAVSAVSAVSAASGRLGTKWTLLALLALLVFLLLRASASAGGELGGRLGTFLLWRFWD